VRKLSLTVPRGLRVVDVDDSDPVPPPRQKPLFPEAEPAEGPIGYTTRILVATTLPHSQPVDNEFTRHSGLYDLCLLTPRRVGLPYGRYPRLILVWLITEAVRRRTPLLYLPRTLSTFASQLGITPSSGSKGTLVQLREQLHRLVNVTFACLGAVPSQSAFPLAPGFYEGGGIRPVKRYLLWWDDPESDPATPYLLLNEDFYQELIAHPIPVSLAVLRSFRSPLEMDVYMWLTWRSVRSLRLQRPEPISWKALHRQFGADYTEEKAFRFNFLRAVKRVLTFYAAIRVKSTRRGFVLYPFPPHVGRRSSPPNKL
jgi:hypothetical protein